MLKRLRFKKKCIHVYNMCSSVFWVRLWFYQIFMEFCIILDSVIEIMYEIN